MAPGPRKKNFNRRGGDNVVDTKKNTNIILETQTKEVKESSPNTVGENDDSLMGNNKMYSKRTVASNWAKYEEPENDPHADTMRGEDFAVLSSYSGGSESQLQLQEEREWDEAIGDKSVTIDLQDLINAVKSIPFHKRNDLPEDIFSKEQLLRFVSTAENCNSSGKLNSDSTSSVPEKKLMTKPESLDSEPNIIESYEPEEMEVDAPTKPLILEEKTENIIESLASCLSLKNLVPEKPASDIEVESEKPPSNVPDDLDFLLSLSISSKNSKQEEKLNVKKQTNVDDWLNSILDD